MNTADGSQISNKCCFEIAKNLIIAAEFDQKNALFLLKC